MAAYWTTTEDEGEVKAYMNALPKIVASRTMHKAGWNNSRVATNIVAEIRQLKQTSEKNIHIFGSAELVASLFPEAGLIDEIMVCVALMALGAGTPLFKPMPVQVPLKLPE